MMDFHSPVYEVHILGIEEGDGCHHVVDLHT
jgi:hypothetical protein